MLKRRERKLDPEKFLSPEKIRIGLLLSSLYLSAFEILKIAIIENIKDFYVFSRDMTDEQAREVVGVLGQDAVSRIRQQYKQEIEEYERQVGVKLDSPDQHALIPSCKWLQRMEPLKRTRLMK